MDEQTINTYNALAKDYDDETVEFWDLFPKEVFDKFISFTGKGRVLDIGSGPGRDAVFLRDRGAEVVCLDASETMIAMTSEKGFESVRADFMHLPFSDESFDGVWAYTALLHISKADVHAPLEEARRVLKKGGIFDFGMIEGEGEIYRESSGVKSPRLFSLYTKHEMETLLHDHGFEVLHYGEFKPRSKNYLNFISKKHD
jgi:ubiquinone/menaquinone biosynthesis C-methylase UbiE